MSRPLFRQPRQLRGSSDLLKSKRLANRYSHQVCYHEAGHAFACWYLNIDLYRVQVRRERKLTLSRHLKTRNGVIHSDASGVSEQKICFSEQHKLLNSNGSPARRRACTNQIFISLAGPLNTLAFYGEGLIELPSAKESGDIGIVNYCRTWIEMGNNPYRRLIFKIIAIMNLPQARKAMLGIAERLARDGWIDGAEVAVLCRAAFVGRSERIKIWHSDTTHNR